MILHLNLNEDHLKLVQFLHIDNDDDNWLRIDRKVMLTVQSHLLDDVAMVLGLRDQVIKGTEADADGGAYPDEVEERMVNAYKYVSDNLYLIETLLHQYATEGLKPGHYTCKDSEMVWSRAD